MPYDNHGRWIPPDDNWRTGKYLVSHKHGWREADAEEIASGQAVNKGSDKDSTYRGQMSWDQIFARDQMDNKARGYDFKGLIESGLIAQEVLEVEDTAYTVQENTDGYYVMDYSKLVTPLIKAVQEQQTIIEDLKARIETLEG